jgi:hypothetical protein
VTVCDTCGTSDCPMHTPRVRRVTTQPDTDAPPTHTPGCSLSTAEASGHNRCGCWCHAGPPFRYMPDEVAAVLRPDLGRCHRETCEHGHVDHRPRNACRWCDCKAFVPSDAPQEGRPTTEAACPKCGHDVDHTTECPGGCPMCARYPGHPPRSLDEELTRIESTYPPSEGRPTTPQTEAGLARRVHKRLYPHSTDEDFRIMDPGSRDRLDRTIQATLAEAAAGALPSVEVAARKVYHGRIGYENPHDPDILALGVALYPHRARLAAAPPEASER